MPRCFITATDTDAGKTWVTAWLTKALNSKRCSTLAIKPIASGCTRQAMNSDSINHTTSDQREWALNCSDTTLLSQVNPPHLMSQLGRASITPYRYEAYCSPARAITLQGDRLDLTDIQRFCQSIPLASMTADSFDAHKCDQKNRPTWILIEGAGGVLSPITPGKTNADLMQALNIPALLVVPNQIGCINHTLLSIQALQKQHISLAGIITTATTPSNLTDNLAELTQWLASTTSNPRQRIPLMSLPYAKQWQDMPEHQLDELSHWFLNLRSLSNTNPDSP